jgi:hypothetical protein
MKNCRRDIVLIVVYCESKIMSGESNVTMTPAELTAVIQEHVAAALAAKNSGQGGKSSIQWRLIFPLRHFPVS